VAALRILRYGKTAGYGKPAEYGKTAEFGTAGYGKPVEYGKTAEFCMAACTLQVGRRSAEHTPQQGHASQSRGPS